MIIPSPTSHSVFRGRARDSGRLVRMRPGFGFVRT